MTIQADTHYVEQYRSRVTHVYQNRGNILKGLLMPEGRLEGKKAWWPVHGSTTAQKKERRKKATPGNVAKSQASADLQTWETFDWIGKFDMTRQTVNEKEALVNAGAMALGAAVDKEITDKFNAVAPTTGTTQFFDISAAELNVGNTLFALGKWRGQNKIPRDGNVYGLLRDIDYSTLMGKKEFSNSQWSGGDLPLRSLTESRTWAGVHWIVVPDDYLPSTGATADLFVFHKPAWGWAENFMIETYFAWDNEYGEWSLRQESEGTAVNLLSQGIARIRVKNDITGITTN
jgi:hypothetical protein